MSRTFFLFALPMLLGLQLVGCSDGGNRVPERGVAKQYVEDNPDLVAAQEAADRDAEKQNN